MDVAEHLGQVAHPVNLQIRYYGLPLREPDALPFFHLPSVTQVLVQVDQQTLGLSAPEVGRGVNTAIRIANNAIVLRFIFAFHQHYRAASDKVMECVRHEPSSEEKCHLICEQYATLELAGTAVTEIDVKVLAPTFASLGGRPGIVARISSQVLTMLACTPYVLLPILSQHRLSMLNTIQLHVPEETRYRVDTKAEMFHFDNDITCWIIEHVECHVPLKVHTFGLSWFPYWRSFLPMLYSMSEILTDGRDFTIKLPAYPHPVIQRALISALEGADDGSNSIPSVPLDGIVSSGMKGKS